MYIKSKDDYEIAKLERRKGNGWMEEKKIIRVLFVG